MSELSRTSALASRHPDLGSGLEVVSTDINGSATVVSTPFVDPDKSRTHA
jgi:hypothetical protein